MSKAVIGGGRLKVLADDSLLDLEIFLTWGPTVGRFWKWHRASGRCQLLLLIPMVGSMTCFCVSCISILVA